MGKHQDRRLTFWQNFIAGGIAGVGSRTFTSPLDVVKIICQVGSKQHTGFIGTFKNVYSQEGLKGFWKVPTYIVSSRVKHRNLVFAFKE